MIIVSAHCMTGGISACFKTIFADHEIKAIPLPANDIERAALAAQLPAATAWFTLGEFQLAEDNPNLQMIKLPKMYFDAFHPDLTYAMSHRTQELTVMNYNSQIAVWCYRNRIDPIDGEKLFNAQTYSALGYYDHWDFSVELMKRHWNEADFTDKEFTKFFWSIKRQSPFMYSVNHPRVCMVVEYAKAMALKFEPKLDLTRREIVIQDGLIFDIWPVYPEIAAELGLRGDYFWRFPQGSEFDGPRSLINFAYKCYEDEGITPEELYACTTLAEIDNVLLGQIEERP